VSRLWFVPSILVVGLLAVGVIGAFSQLLSPAQGFYLFLAGVLIAALSSVVLAGASAYASATGRAWRGTAVRAAIVPVLAFVAVVLPRALEPTPIMNDVTTDLEDPPAFAREVAAAPGAAAQDPRPDFTELQRIAYPDIQPLASSEAPAQSFQRALEVAREMSNWEVTDADTGQRLIYAVATSRIFGFRDDIVIRVRAQGEGSRIDLRSRSRLGRGDMGANAARIRTYQERFRAVSE